ncbi:MAG: DUF448 domain-containing protein [Sphingomonas bacterium]|nr:DUF448 domain-containing protein [Sphingomonas bacterium]
MRHPTDETLTPPDSNGVSDTGGEPVRSCILTRDRDARDHLVRLALGPDDMIWPDVRAKAPGRGAWIGVTRAELEQAIAKKRLRGALARAFKGATFTIPDDLPDRIEAALHRNAMDRLGLESKSGALLSGSEKIATAARSGQLAALYHAADASIDGNRKLDQAWRIGMDREGSDLRGLVLPMPRPILSLALGRENVVHIGLTDRAAAKRVSDALDRWLHFIGPDLPLAPCEATSRGSSAPEKFGHDTAPDTGKDEYEEFE